MKKSSKKRPAKLSLRKSSSTKSPLEKALRTKSEESGIPYRILKQVHNRGKAAWNTGHRPGCSQNQWAMGRVNSFITGVGSARKADKDLWDRVKPTRRRAA